MKLAAAISILSIVFSLHTVRPDSGEAPRITEHPLDILVTKGDPATLRCEASGENVVIIWYKDSEPVKVGNGHRLLLPNGSLFLLKVNNGGTDSDAGTYYCIARNEYGQIRSQEANVRVAMLRDDFRLNPHAVQALIGNRVTLECTPPKGFPDPIVTWRRDEKELNLQEDNKYHQSPDGSLIIENAQRSDAGFYQCVATNVVGERVSKPARLSVYEKPKFLVEPKNVVAEVNSSVLFECKVFGEPLPSISWKKRDGQMPIGRAYVARDRGGLRIDRIQPEDSGEYTCYAKNPIGSIESSAQLRVDAPPVFTKVPQNLRLAPGKMAIFECEAVGQPTPGIFWSKEGDQLFTFFSGLVSSDGRIQVTNEGRLIIDSVRHFDQGNYVCAAVNSAGSTLAKASLGIINNASSSYPPPIIQYGHQNQTLMLNDMAILPCQATGRVPAQITWLKNGQELDLNSTDNKGRYRQLSVGTLQISDLKKEDTGVFTCRARNEDGEATWTASLVVEQHTNQDTIFQRMPDAAALPSPPGQPRLLNASEDFVEMEWTVPERQGASPIIGYILQYWSPEMGESWQNVHDVVSKTRFRVKHLKPAHSYVFVVRAENSKGIGLPSTASEMMATKSSTTPGEMDERGGGGDHRMNRMLDLETARQRLASEQLVKLLEVRTLNATAMLLTWKRQRKEPLVQGYYIKWRGPPLAQDHSWVNITGAEIDHVIINGLRPFNNYEFFVIPYHQQVQGMPSNSLDGTTAESPPTMSPADVRLRMLNITSLRVSWRPPPADHINGILKGFLINIRSNHSSVEDRNITTNERATSVTLYRLIPNASYAIKVAARTNAGVGVFFNGESVLMNEDTLHRHIRLFERAESNWYRQPWVVLGCGIVLWCLLLLVIVLFWYRCCHRGRANAEGKKEHEFIKIRDGSVCAPNTTALSEARNAFWAAHEHYNGGTVETFSGTLARPAAALVHQHQPHSNYSTEYAGSCCNGNAVAMNNEGGMLQLNHPQQQHAALHCSATLQRINNGDCGIHHHHHHPAHSPSHHYHYAQLPPEPGSASLSTFLQQRPPQYYDDPSPYATTTICNPMGGQTLRVHKGPALPLNPAPKDPPRNFLSSVAVIRSANCDGQDQPTSNSCSALLELDPEQQHQRITAVTLHQQQQRRQHKGGKASQQHGHFGTAVRMTTGSRNGGAKKNVRSSSVTTSAGRHVTSIREHNNTNMGRQQQQESPQTDISYIQSSDGTCSSSSKPNGCYPSSSNYSEAPQYDPVMTESMHQILQEKTRRNRGKERGRQNSRNRVSLIEDEQQAEKDPLMACNGDGEAEEEEEEERELEADAEMSEQSDEYVYGMNGNVVRRSNNNDNKEMNNYYGFSPAQSRPNRQPMMGVNISTLSGK